MPAAKDLILLNGHWTKEQYEEKERKKASVTPSVKLKPPKNIRGNSEYRTIWNDVLKLYKGTELLNALDRDLLARYVIEKHALEQLYLVRARSDIQADTELMLKVETRIEAKTKMLNQMALALYMTPRARAGSIPKQAETGKTEEDLNVDLFD